MSVDPAMYRQQLLDAGFQEAVCAPFCFFRMDTALTAFFVNLKELEDRVCVFYGFASTAFTRMAGCENSLIERGIWEQDNCLRFYAEIRTEADAVQLRTEAEARYRMYAGTCKEALVKLLQDRRKAFLKQIQDKLKPLGFRKKGNQWRKPLAENVFLQFWADKNPYADLYYFEVDIYCTASTRGLWCYTERLHNLSVDPFTRKGRVLDSDDFDWQLQSPEALEAILERALEQYLLPIMRMSLSELGQQRFIWNGCICPRDCCESCWVQKNLWEAKES